VSLDGPHLPLTVIPADPFVDPTRVYEAPIKFGQFSARSQAQYQERAMQAPLTPIEEDEHQDNDTHSNASADNVKSQSTKVWNYLHSTHSQQGVSLLGFRSDAP
jgi:hypothetical protein